MFDDVIIFDKIVIWNEVKDICEKRGLFMLILDLEEKLSVLINCMFFVGFDLWVLVFIILFVMFDVLLL